MTPPPPEPPASTDPSGPSGPDGPGPQARSFGAGAAEYDRVRPGYPAAVLTWALGSGPRTVLDLGAGTGTLTRLLLEQGHEVVAVDPDPLMLQRLQASAPHVRTLTGTGEAIPLPAASVDAVLAAQAWHWMDPAQAAPEVARVLRPGGVLVVMWNLRDPQHPLGRAISDAVAAHAGDLVGPAGTDPYAQRRDASVPDPRLTPAGSTVVDSSRRYSVDDLLALVGTWSYVALSPGREEVLDQVRRTAEALAAPDGTVVLAQAVHAHRFLRS